MSFCSVIMVSYNTGPALLASVKSVLRQQRLAELVLVDNGNPPDSLSLLQQMALGEPRLRILTGHGNIGFAKGCNKGAKQVSGDYLLLLNPDCLLPPDALAQSMTALQNYPQAVLAGPLLLDPEGGEQRGGRRKLLTPGSGLADTFPFSRLNRSKRPLPEIVHEVTAISGACMFIRKVDFDKLGGLDEAFFLHVEDMDICMRVQKAGGKIILVPAIKVTHMLSTSKVVSTRFLEWQRARGFIYYFNKHFARETVFGYLFLVNLAIIIKFFLRSALPSERRPHYQTIAQKRLMILASGLADLPETQEFSGTTVLVIGATGQVGLCIVRRLLAAGAAVLAISRAEAIPFHHENLRWLRGDLTDKKLHLDGYLVDVVMHCAPLWHLPPVLDLLQDAEVKRIIAFSSTSVFANALSHNKYEKNMVDKLSKAEKFIEERCTAKSIRWTLMRPTLIYGVGLDVNITSLAKFIRRYRFFPVYPPALGRRQPVHADDLAQGALAACFAPAAFDKAYNVSGGEVLAYHVMLERIFFLMHRKIRIISSTMLPFMLDVAGWCLRKKHINGEIARRMNDDLVFFHDEAAKDFNYHPRGF